MENITNQVDAELIVDKCYASIFFNKVCRWSYLLSLSYLHKYVIYARKMLMHVRFRSLEKKLMEWMSLEFQPQLQSAILISQYGKMMEEKYLTKFEVNS
jgi:hypothetical protein